MRTRNVNELILQVLRASVPGVIVFGLLLFVPAWTLDYWQAWLFIAVFMGSANAIGMYLAINDPALLDRRMKAGPASEKETGQRILISFALLVIAALLVFCSLDYRFGWSPVSPYVSLAGDALIALGFLIDFFVFKENSFGASTVQTFEEQSVISTGPYALVRHPMYVGVLIMMIGVPLALGS